MDLGISQDSTLLPLRSTEDSPYHRYSIVQYSVVQYMYMHCTCTVHVQYVYSTCIVHLQLMYSTAQNSTVMPFSSYLLVLQSSLQFFTFSSIWIKTKKIIIFNKNVTKTRVITNWICTIRGKNFSVVKS